MSQRARELGRALAKKDVILLTGACDGIPHQVVTVAYQAGLREILGFSPSRNLKEHEQETPGIDNTIFSRIEYVSPSFPFNDIQARRKFRNVTTTATCDAGILVSGRIGTLNEFTNLYDMGKVIGVLTGLGGVADALEDLMQKISKPSKAVVVYNSSPEQLVKKVLAEVKKRRDA